MNVRKFRALAIAAAAMLAPQALLRRITALAPAPLGYGPATP